MSGSQPDREPEDEAASHPDAGRGYSIVNGVPIMHVRQPGVIDEDQDEQEVEEATELPPAKERLARLNDPAEVEKIKAMGFSDERIEGMRRAAQREIERFGG